FIYRHLFARAVRRLEVLANSQAAIFVNTPGQLDPKLVFLPYLTGIGTESGAAAFTSHALSGDLSHRLAEAYPTGSLCLVAVKIMTLRTESHRQDIVRKPGRL